MSFTCSVCLYLEEFPNVFDVLHTLRLSRNGILCLTFSCVKNRNGFRRAYVSKHRDGFPHTGSEGWGFQAQNFLSQSDNFVTSPHILPPVYSGEASMPTTCASLIYDSTGVVAMSSREFCRRRTSRASLEECPRNLRIVLHSCYPRCDRWARNLLWVAVRHIGQTALQAMDRAGQLHVEENNRWSARCGMKRAFSVFFFFDDGGMEGCQCRCQVMKTELCAPHSVVHTNGPGLTLETRVSGKAAKSIETEASLRLRGNGFSPVL